jgi:hypothetical protein
MDHALDVYPDVRVLDSLDALPAATAMGKEREGVARDLIENRIVVPARKGHREAGSRLNVGDPTLLDGVACRNGRSRPQFVRPDRPPEIS